MKTNSRTILLLAALGLCHTLAVSQTVTSIKNGMWADPATWNTGIVPTSANATQIIVDHVVELTSGSTIAVLQLVIHTSLTLRSGATLSILADALPAVPDLLVTGTLISEEGSILNGTSVANTVFDAGSTYVHQQGPLGFIPYATWHATSTFQISGFTTSGYINIAHSDSWKQAFGNVVYDCPLQTVFVVDLNGYLRSVAGDFIVRNTNRQVLRLATTQNPTITIGGNLLVEGPSEVWFCTTGTATVINIGKDFRYLSTSTGPSYLTTRGAIVFSIKGNLDVNAAGPIRLASSAADSSGVRQATLAMEGNLSIIAGTLIAPPAGSGTGKVIFKGTATQYVVASGTGSSFQGNMDYTVETTAKVDLGMSVLSSTTGSLRVKGKLCLGSTDPGGAIQLINKGNIYIPGPRIFDAGATLEYNASAAQWVGPGHPAAAGLNMVCNNAVSVTFLQDVTAADFSLERGSVHAGGYGLSVYGDLGLKAGANIPVLSLLGGRSQNVSAGGVTLQDILVNKTGSTPVNITSPLLLQGKLTVLSTNTTVQSNGNLTVVSLSDGATGTGSIGALPVGSSIAGDVTIQRFMSGEGRIYRYLSSPVENATVASLMDDFPVTGTFADASTGPGISTTAPSLYFYDQSAGGLQQGWKPYPTAGLAAASPLEKGRGYAAFIRKRTGSTILDFTGPLNHGTLTLPTAFTPNSAPSNGWNLVGNPYACGIDWDITGADGWTKTNISPVISIRDNGAGGMFRYWDGDVNYDDIPEGHIAAGQAFWVRATGVSPALIIREGVKISGDAAFYREAADEISSFSLALMKDSITDKAYLKIRPGASSAVDPWDAVKMENDVFDLSIGDGAIPLAINARDKLPCEAEVIPIRMADLTTGTYFLTLSVKYNFSNYDYICEDHFLNASVKLVPDRAMRFEVTDDRASASPNRFSLHLKEITPSDSIVIQYPEVVCKGDGIPVILSGGQAGVHYWIGSLSGNAITGESDGNETTVALMLRTDSLLPGTYRWLVNARAVCRQVTLRRQVVVTVVSPPSIEALTGTGCMGQGVTLNVSSPQAPITVSWFESTDTIDTLATGLSWTTPPLLKSKVYYAAGALTPGCNSVRIPVKANVTPFEQAAISCLDSVTLVSNYPDGNEWYCGQLRLPEQGPAIRPEQDGRYILRVRVLDCYSSDTLDFFRTSYAGGFSVYPNPTSGTVKVQAERDTALAITVWDALGKFVHGLRVDEEERDVTAKRVDTTGLSAGVYFLHVVGRTTSAIIRLVKK